MTALSDQSAAPDLISDRELSRPEPPNRRAAEFWIGGALMATVRYCPWLTRAIRPVLLGLAWRCSPFLRERTLAAVRSVHGTSLGPTRARRIARAMIAHHYDFVTDFGRLRRRSVETILDEIEAVEGLERYEAVRARGRGAVLATAHLGVFETAIAAIARSEPRVNVVFKRDPMRAFEDLRTEWRRRLGVIEAAVDDGPSVWIDLRDALRRNEVVLIQADRVLPGQKGITLPFLGGRLEFATGPVRLALAAGAPLVPVFAWRTETGRIRIRMEEPLPTDDAERAHDVNALVARLAHVIEEHVRRHLEQWFVLGLHWWPDSSSTQTR